MSMKFSLQGDSLLISKPDDTGSMKSLDELLHIMQRLSSSESVREAVQTTNIAITLDCETGRRSYSLLNSNNRDEVKKIVENAVEQTDKILLSMRKHGTERLVCRLASAEQKPYWFVELACDISYRELAFFSSVLKDVGILNLNKNPHH